jgi:large subunit ribosomal protein L21
MYAVIRTGGKQERVTEGQRLAVELLPAPVGDEVDLEAVLVVDGTEILATPDQLAGASVRAQVVGLELGPKIRAGTYKSKSNQRRRWGHRQRFSTIEILSISGSAPKKAAPRKSRAKAAEPADAE